LENIKLNTNAFLKINRTGPSSIACLRHWLEIFRNHNTYILCDWPQPWPQELISAQQDYPQSKIISSDRSLTEYCGALKGAKHGMASANLTGFTYSQNADAFWMIDADDTQFLTYDFDLIRQKVQRAEQVFQEQLYDAFSLDFYRNLNNGWTFGMALIRSSCPWQRMQELTGDELVAQGMARNIDTAFHVMGLKGILKIGNFVFDRLAFQHLYNNYPAMPHGIYNWHKGNLWDKPLQSDVIIL
jgi:hypothetical protein